MNAFFNMDSTFLFGEWWGGPVSFVPRGTVRSQADAALSVQRGVSQPAHSSKRTWAFIGGYSCQLGSLECAPSSEWRGSGRCRGGVPRAAPHERRSAFQAVAATAAALKHYNISALSRHLLLVITRSTGWERSAVGLEEPLSRVADPF